jgi:hypothetical protein
MAFAGRESPTDAREGKRTSIAIITISPDNAATLVDGDSKIAVC